MDQKLLATSIKNSIKFQSLIMLIIGYAIGAGFISYLGMPLQMSIFWLGLVIVLLFNLSSDLLSFYFSKNLVSIFGKTNKNLLILKNYFLIISFSILTIGATLTVLLVYSVKLGAVLWIYLGLFLGILVVNALPPFNLASKGFGDFLITFSVVALAPSFSYFLQSGEIHSVLFLITFPAFFLLIAYFLAQNLEKYYEDLKENKKTLMVIFGWKNGMKMHNYFLLFSYLLYGLSTILGLSLILALPALISFPVALLQFWEMWRIGEGNKPRWKFLKITSVGSISLLAYFILFNLWLR